VLWKYWSGRLGPSVPLSARHKGQECAASTSSSSSNTRRAVHGMIQSSSSKRTLRRRLASASRVGKRGFSHKLFHLIHRGQVAGYRHKSFFLTLFCPMYVSEGGKKGTKKSNIHTPLDPILLYICVCLFCSLSHLITIPTRSELNSILL